MRERENEDQVRTKSTEVRDRTADLAYTRKTNRPKLDVRAVPVARSEHEAKSSRDGCGSSLAWSPEEEE
ncbi:unnamed protein product [Heligmosomoides polygyrus]|uniref:Uncharacterized protein n=1 Tax=Heligmosomoides polygyrus TaxID=6339 RepID=A0A183FG77_HELPZ|nr:unnamed protein product [Heligmosomoides polygyrus]